MRYLVGAREVWVALHEIEADTPEEAKELVFNRFDNEIDLEYSHTLDSEHTTVEEL